VALFSSISQTYVTQVITKHHHRAVLAQLDEHVTEIRQAGLMIFGQILNVHDDNF